MNYQVNSFQDSIKSGMTEFFEELKEKLDGLTESELSWQASLDSNSIIWLVWHMALVEDKWISNSIVGKATIWESSNWAERTGIYASGYGYGQTMDIVRALPSVSISTLVEYYDEVRDATFGAIDAMSDDDVANIDIQESGDASWGWILAHIIVEESQHLGQIAFIRGIIRGLDG